MKQARIAITCLALLTVMASCQKENGTVTLGVRIDNIDGNQKLYITGVTPQWEEDDPVWINGNGNYTVTFNNNTAQITNVTRDNQYTAVYPANIVLEGQTGSNGTVTVNLPREPHYLSNGDNQQSKLPMIANYDGQDLHFKNLCSLVKVTVTNSTGNSISISRITLTASSAMLSGSTTASIITDEDDNKHGHLGDWDNDAEHDVSLVFSTPESIESTGKDFYLSVPEFGNTELSIIIYTNNNQFLPVLKNSVNLAHNSIATVSVTISNQNQLLTTQEAFTVNGNNTKVRFSKGNLQYSRQGTHTTADNYNTGGTWRFAKHQYDIIGANNDQISNTNYTGWIDLFGYGTSGRNGKAPTTYSNSNTDYRSSIISNTNYDWGVYNSIEDDVYNTWRTLTYAEWSHLLGSRTGVNIGTSTDAKFAEATVNGTNGAILFPDGYTWPSTVSNIPSLCNCNAGGWDNTPNYTIAKWAILEAAGAIFLPCSGYRKISETKETNNYAWYWTSTIANTISGTAYYIVFDNNNSSVNLGSNHNHYGLSVRLVRDVHYNR